MATEHASADMHNSGILALAFIANYLHQAVPAKELASQLSSGWHAGEQDLIYLAKYFLDFRVERRKLKINKVSQNNVPAIVHNPEKGYAALLRVEQDRVFIFLPDIAKVETLALESFYEQYSGHLITVKNERDTSSLPFGFRWLPTAGGKVVQLPKC